MTARPVIWLAGISGSVLAHLALLGLILLSIRPDPVEEQPMPGSELEVQAYRLERTRARERPAETDAARESEATGAALDSGAIPRTRATAARPAAQALGDAVPAAEPLGEARADAPELAAATVTPPAASAAPQRVQAVAQARPQTAPARPAAIPRPSAVAAVTRPAERIAPAASASAPLPEARVTPGILPRVAPEAVTLAAQDRPAPDLPAAQPETAPAATVNAAADALPPSRPDIPTATPEQAQGIAVGPAAPSARKVKAALAFSGADGDVDPVSLAAFQSFMRPGDAAAAGDRMRDGIAGLLAQVPCSRLQVGFDPDTATLQVSGHVPENGLRAPVLAALREQMGADIAVSDNILILPRPQCGALSGIADVGLPQSTDQFTNPLVIGEDTHARVFRFTKGSLLSLDMTAPDYDAFIYLDYFDADGNVLHLEPNEHAPLRRARAKQVHQIGARTAQDAGLKLVVGPPYGQEIAVAFAASAPLYEGLRPIQEPAAPYLAWLKDKVAEARAADDGFKGEWVYFFVATAER